MLLEFYKLFTKRRQINHNIVSFRTKLPNGGLEKKSVVAGVLWNGKMGVNPIKNMSIVKARDNSNDSLPMLPTKPTKPPNASSSKQAFDLRKKLVDIVNETDESVLRVPKEACLFKVSSSELLGKDPTIADWTVLTNQQKEKFGILEALFNEAAGLQGMSLFLSFPPLLTSLFMLVYRTNIYEED